MMEDLKNKIEYWMGHSTEKEACSRAYAGYAERFDFDRCIEQTEQMLPRRKNERKKGCLLY